MNGGPYVPTVANVSLCTTWTPKQHLYRHYGTYTKITKCFHPVVGVVDTVIHRVAAIWPPESEIRARYTDVIKER